ncbi:MAG: hypothetical protein ORN49_03100, partial [Rhodobacteraceae bacterium]|nr:hypothetical protein [Paracoccaceae bacterium]
VWRIGLTAPLAAIVAREAERCDRSPGLGRAQIERVHRAVRYDLCLDMSILPPDMAACRIAELAGLAPQT